MKLKSPSVGLVAETEDATSALSTTALGCGHGGKPILDDLELVAPTGRLVCIVGPNGIGKSTLVRTLAGLLPVISGTVQLSGRPLDSWSPAERARRVSIVLTGLPSIGYLTVRRFVEIGRHPYTGRLGRLNQDDRQVVETALEQVGIGNLASRFLGEISDGERQRAAIARAFAQSANVMILDEPTAFLDVESRALIMTTLRDLAHNSGRTVVATSHDIDLVLRIADEAWMIKPDRTIARGAPEDLVLAGTLEEVFPHHVMEFDLESGSFRLPRPTGPVVEVAGRRLAATWTARAIERIGMRALVKGKTDEHVSDIRVKAVDQPGAKWILESSTGQATLSSISELINHLQNA